MVAGAGRTNDRLRARLCLVAERLAGRRTPRQVLESLLLRPLLASVPLRVGLFRIIEAYPSLRTPAAVLRRVVEELDADGVPSVVRLAVRAAARVPGGDRLVAAVAEQVIDATAGRFIAGRDADDALPVVRRLWDDGVGVVVDALGEKTVTGSEADAYVARVLDLVERLGDAAVDWPGRPILARDHHGPLPRVAVAVKPTACSPRFGPTTPQRGLDEAAARLVPVLRAAARHDVFVWLDMEEHDVVDLTHRLLWRLADEVPEADLGIVVQAYLVDAHEHLEELLDWARDRTRPLGVRLVKGAYWDHETALARRRDWPMPVLQQKWAADASYDRCAELLVANADVVRPAFGSHNLRSLARAIACAQLAGLPQVAPEIQVLHGMAGTLPAGTARIGVRTRVYVPVGELVPGMSYLVRRLLENTANTSFLRQQDLGGADLDELLADPPPLSEADPPPTDLRRDRTPGPSTSADEADAA